MLGFAARQRTISSIIIILITPPRIGPVQSNLVTNTSFNLRTDSGLDLPSKILIFKQSLINNSAHLQSKSAEEKLNLLWLQAFPSSSDKTLIEVLLIEMLGP
ncbi:hypothetical protein PMIT1323_00589 [Prochlorococcus marinus str. MIT 1323]|nr:hypothetical protein PMIT1323_00589 [Prochlorococcus marinus str. MIT 1323]